MAWISLKTQNLPLLAILVVTQVGVAYGLSHPDFDWKGIEVFTADSVVMAIITVLVALFSSLLPASIKHQLVYLRLNNALPGHRFMKLAANDQRIDVSLLEQKIHSFMPPNASAEQQNQVWYRHIYQPLQNDPLIKDAHKALLLWRDSMTVSLVTGLLLVIGGVNVPWVAKIFEHYSLSVPFCFVFACGLAANNCGKRMVTNAVAIWLRH
ncbi:hypothetical protein [Shewanella glacialipiscicola]|uniref:hypothetical protein n=1 Tax=Shewanella glacialipiscicola TaxID=614069 RepID=UPI003D7B2064